jgi:hypothetical protein
VRPSSPAWLASAQLDLVDLAVERVLGCHPVAPEPASSYSSWPSGAYLAAFDSTLHWAELGSIGEQPAAEAVGPQPGAGGGNPLTPG